MNEFRRSSERGHADRGRLDSRHGFSFADHCQPRHTGGRAKARVNGAMLGAGDALKSEGDELAIDRGEGAEVLVRDLPGRWPLR